MSIEYVHRHYKCNIYYAYVESSMCNRVCTSSRGENYCAFVMLSKYQTMQMDSSCKQSRKLDPDIHSFYTEIVHQDLTTAGGSWRIFRGGGVVLTYESHRVSYVADRWFTGVELSALMFGSLVRTSRFRSCLIRTGPVVVRHA